MMIEVWKDIGGYEGLYQVSNFGKVRSIIRLNVKENFKRIFEGKELKPTKHNGKQPYFYVSLSKYGKSKKIFVHRLVAKMFIDNPSNKKQVNHIDGNVQNNRVDNLEWVTNAENTQHAYDTKLNVKQQLCITYKGEVKSLRRWCRELDLNYKKTWYRFRQLHWSIEKCFEEVVSHVKH